MSGEVNHWSPASGVPLIENLSLLRAFVAVVETGSFRRAGQRLNVVPSTISKHIAALEARFRGQLIVRSTQKLSISELGRQFYEHALSILHEVDEAERAIGEYNAEPQGILKVTAGTVFALHHLGDSFVRFLKKYPRIKLDVSLETTTNNLIGDGIDVAIRISNDLDPELIAVKLASNTRVYCASPAYLAGRGVPKVPEDLKQHNCLFISGVPASSRWPIKMPDGTTENVIVAGNFATNNGDLTRQALLSGLGIGRLALFIVHKHLESGELVELFPESRAVASHIYAVYPERRNLPLKTRVFIDHLKSEFHGSIPWSE